MTVSDDHVAKLTSFISKGIFRRDHSLRLLTSIKIGGLAKLFIQTNDTDELRHVLEYCANEKIRLFILGGGSNLLFSDGVFDGVVLKVADMGFVLERQEHSVRLTLGAGYMVNLAATKLIDEGLSGFEYLFGLPGTVGGAIYMNSKWPKDHFAISDAIEKVSYLSQTGELETYDQQSAKFSYGFSPFQNKKGIILGASFILLEKDRQTIRKLCEEVRAYRHASQPTGVLTAGCVFKNITEEERIRYDLPTRSAGYLIDRAGFKNTTYGGLLVSPVHANFFVNTGKATAKEYVELVELIRQKVREQAGVVLREEVVVVQ